MSQPTASSGDRGGVALSYIDFAVLAAYMGGVCVIGLIASAKVRNATDMFAAGRSAPWWVSGLSGYMTKFSAATFVVWGSVAYRYGLVAVAINLTYGVAALLVGFFVAGRWRRLGVTTAAEFIELRFGKAALTTFTALNLFAKMLAIGVGLYALAVMICALAPMAPGAPFRDPSTGHLSVRWTIMLLGGMVVLFTATGGLWAVLVTDVVQFVIIMMAVCLVALLAMSRAGGVAAFMDAAPEGFFQPVSGEWTWWLLAGWCAIQFMMIGAEWAFVQRYLCVSSQRSAQKSAWLFGTLYLTTPLVWMLPPMVYRTIDPHADPEQAYILACQSVLPAGTIGLMLAAMAAATLSGIDSQINAFAGVLTNDFYKPYLRPQASEPEMLRVGRLATATLGVALIGLAMLAPRWGGAEAFIVSVTSLYVGPLLMPTIWGLFSKKLGASAVWITVSTTAAAATFVFAMQSWTVPSGNIGWIAQVARWLQGHPRHVDMLIGLALPFGTLVVLELKAREVSPGWRRLSGLECPDVVENAVVGSSALTLRACGWTLIASGMAMGGLIWFEAQQWHVLATFASVLLALGAAAMWMANKSSDHAAPMPLILTGGEITQPCDDASKSCNLTPPTHLDPLASSEVCCYENLPPMSAPAAS